MKIIPYYVLIKNIYKKVTKRLGKKEKSTLFLKYTTPQSQQVVAAPVTLFCISQKILIFEGFFCSGLEVVLFE